MKFADDDRGDVVDFYDIDEDGNYERIARLNREATVNGVPDQLSLANWGGGLELLEWMRENDYEEELDEAEIINE